MKIMDPSITALINYTMGIEEIEMNTPEELEKGNKRWIKRNLGLGE